jgi:hypothetical protein
MQGADGQDRAVNVAAGDFAPCVDDIGRGDAQHLFEGFVRGKARGGRAARARCAAAVGKKRRLRNAFAFDDEVHFHRVTANTFNIRRSVGIVHPAHVVGGGNIGIVLMFGHSHFPRAPAHVLPNENPFG